MTVLIVDDDVRFRDLARRMLTGWGYLAGSEAGSVAEALQQAARSHPDVALVDVGLPDGNGLELTRLLTRAPSQVRVVLISSDSDAVSALEATTVGAAAFIPKNELSGALLRSIIDQDESR